MLQKDHDQQPLLGFETIQAGTISGYTRVDTSPRDRIMNAVDTLLRTTPDSTVEVGLQGTNHIAIDLREGLQDTPSRFAKAWEEWTAGYNVDIPGLLKVFEDGAEGYDEMVIVKNIPIYSKCEHHLADIFGTATIAYIPNGKVVGLSKLSRLADAFARRLQVQERLTVQIVDALMQHLEPKGAACIIRARHMCMESRGLCQQGHHTITSALRGVLKEPAARAEFMQLAKD